MKQVVEYLPVDGRVQRLLVSLDWLIELLRALSTPDRLVTARALPADLTVVGVQVDGCDGQIVVLVHSASFPPVPSGGQPPAFSPSFIEHHLLRPQ